ncbi:hypothetical protein ACP4I1_36055 [Streptomyces sp. WG4]|uniref:hypothetical protein n=1 Tax=Streptomyces sp. WG4 TaxID=3417649 RepID=UPI003CEFDFB6
MPNHDDGPAASFFVVPLRGFLAHYYVLPIYKSVALRTDQPHGEVKAVLTDTSLGAVAQARAFDSEPNR